VIVEKLVECKLAGETEVLGENLPQRHFAHHMPTTGFEPGPPRWEANDYYYLVCEAIGTAATPDLLCQPRVIVKMIVEINVSSMMQHTKNSLVAIVTPETQDPPEM
jgi:hypothetical protein